MPAPGLNAAPRRAQPADAPLLLQLDRAVSLSPWSAAEYRRLCALDPDADEGILVIDAGASVAGFAVFARLVDEGSIHNVVVAPERQRQGLGRELVLAILEAAPGVRRWLLEVRASNTAARALYRELGFSEDGRRPGYYAAAGREDAVLMSLSLGKNVNERA